MNLAKNNLDTQVSLMKDIIYNDHNIIYHIKEKGVSIVNTLQSATYNKEDETYTLSKEKLNLILDIGYILSDDRKFEKLGILAQQSVPDNEIKKKILAMLQKQ